MVPVCSLTWCRWAFIGNTFCSSSAVLMKTNSGALCPSWKRGPWNHYELPVHATTWMRSFGRGEDLHIIAEFTMDYEQIPWAAYLYRGSSCSHAVWGEGSGLLAQATVQLWLGGGISSSLLWTDFTMQALHDSLLPLHIETAIWTWGSVYRLRDKGRHWDLEPDSLHVKTSHVILCESLSFISDMQVLLVLTF